MANEHDLSEGSLHVIMQGGKIENPIMQVLGSKKINTGSSDKERYRLCLSDGKYTISFAMLTTQSNEKMDSGGVPDYSIIKIKNYITSVINNAGKGDTRVLLILDMDLLTDGKTVGKKIGNPVQYNEATAGDKTTNSTPSQNGNSSKPNVVISKPSSSNSSMNQSSICNTQIISPISSLSPYHNKWVIKARIMNKSPIRTWSNSRGEGKLFSIDLIDESGEIRCTGFRDMVDKFYELIQVDKVYYLSKCQLKPANKQFSTLKNDYEMTMTSETVVEECHEADSQIPQAQYDFTPIDKLASTEVGTVVDVIGVCQSVSDLQTIIARSTGRELKKRELNLVDQSKAAITLTLWGNEAENFCATNTPVIVIKGAKVGEFGGGKNLSAAMSSQLKINPEIPECFRLKGWFDIEGTRIEVNNISARTGVGNFQTPWMTFKEVQEQSLGQNERGDYYQLMGTVLLIRSENAVYKACPTEECNKKVIDLENGQYRCEKCNREFPNFKYRLLVSMNVGDWTGNQWISLFSSEAEKVLGMTSQQIGEAIENDKEAAARIFENVNFKQFIFKCRAKMEVYNDEARLKTVAVKVDPINYKEYNAYLIDRIKQLTP